EIGRENLDRNVALERLVASEEDDPHAAATDPLAENDRRGQRLAQLRGELQLVGRKRGEAAPRDLHADLAAARRAGDGGVAHRTPGRSRVQQRAAGATS